MSKWFLVPLLVLAVLATVYVLARGVIGLIQGNVTPQRSQELMQKRIMFQAIAVGLAILILLIASS